MAPPAVELSTTAAVRSAITAGTAPGVLGELAVRDDLVLHRLAAVAVSGLSLRRPLTAIWLTGTEPPAGPARDLAAIAAGPERQRLGHAGRSRRTSAPTPIVGPPNAGRGPS